MKNKLKDFILKKRKLVTILWISWCLFILIITYLDPHRTPYWHFLPYYLKKKKDPHVYETRGSF